MRPSLHLSDVTWAPSNLKSPATPLFVEQIVQACNKANIKALRDWLFLSPAVSAHKGLVMLKTFPCHNIIMEIVKLQAVRWLFALCELLILGPYDQSSTSSINIARPWADTVLAAQSCTWFPQNVYGYLKQHVFNHTSLLTRRSENDNTPQPLDQWTNSPFIGQQVGNCKSFTLTHYLPDLFAMHRGPRSIPLCIQHHIQLTSLSFQVSQTSHSWVTAISIFYLKNPRSMSWVRSKCEVTMWV